MQRDRIRLPDTCRSPQAGVGREAPVEGCQLAGQQRALSNNAIRKGLVNRIAQVGGLTQARNPPP
jgi:hypothetical protein